MTAAQTWHATGTTRISKFWQMLKEGYDHFEITRVPPKVDVCNRRYVFNSYAENGRDFSPTAACPPMTQPEATSDGIPRPSEQLRYGVPGGCSGGHEHPARVAHHHRSERSSPGRRLVAPPRPR